MPPIILMEDPTMNATPTALGWAKSPSFLQLPLLYSATVVRSVCVRPEKPPIMKTLSSVAVVAYCPNLN